MTTEAPRQPASFEFKCDGPAWNGIPVVNGYEILSATRIDVHIDPSDGLPVVDMKLSVSDAMRLGLDPAKLRLDDGTRDALISLGWTPPPGAEQEP